MSTYNTRASKRVKAAEVGQSLYSNGNGGSDYFEVEEVLDRRILSSGSDTAGVVEYCKFS
jgi:hypothetical protein